MRIIDEIVSLAKTEKVSIRDFVRERIFSLEPHLSVLQKHEINALYILGIDSANELSSFLGSSISELNDIMNSPLYKPFLLLKKKGGLREISAPGPDLKRIQKQLNYYLQAYYLWIKPEQVHGFVINPHYLGKHCNIVSNASIHINRKFLLNIDLKDFFPSITARQVKDLFTSRVFRFNDEIATAMTLLTTYQGKIPQGSPASPVISNFICLPLDEALIRYCEDNAISYSRYADDLTFSSDRPIMNDAFLDIFSIIREQHFTINQKKLHYKTSNRKQTVTGLTVNAKVNVDRKLLKKIRAMLHDFTLNGLSEAARNHFNIQGTADSRSRLLFYYRLKGYINFVGQVRGKDDKVYLRMKAAFRSETYKLQSDLNQP